MSMWPWLKRRRMRLDEDGFQEEIRAHLAMAEQDRIESGSARETGRYAARKEFGNVTLTTEAARRVWTPRLLIVSATYIRMTAHTGFTQTARTRRLRFG